MSQLVLRRVACKVPEFTGPAVRLGAATVTSLMQYQLIDRQKV
jgi:hypothetical protein